MKFAEPRPFADPEAATRKLVEIANAIETAQDGRIQGPPRGTEKPPSESTLRFPGRPPKFAPGKPTSSRQVGGPAINPLCVLDRAAHSQSCVRATIFGACPDR
jgi:hypothetical protein